MSIWTDQMKYRMKYKTLKPISDISRAEKNTYLPIETEGRVFQDFEEVITVTPKLGGGFLFSIHLVQFSTSAQANGSVNGTLEIRNSLGEIIESRTISGGSSQMFTITNCNAFSPLHIFYKHNINLENFKYYYNPDQISIYYTLDSRAEEDFLIKTI